MTLWEGRVRSLVERREIRDEDFHVEKRFSYGSKVERMQLLSLNMRLAVAIPQHEVTICSLFSEEERMRLLSFQ
ncbi:hypothetical protein ACLOJK_034202 [Asimina triloba]